ncbi:MAG: VanZ family protein [Turicibacter sp.]|nr:VanZ family protein [Turicibacter sp.]
MKKVLNIGFYAGIVIYLFLVASATLLIRRGGSFRSVNLVPFRQIWEFMSGPNPAISRINLLGNVAMFIPMGI